MKKMTSRILALVVALCVMLMPAALLFGLWGTLLLGPVVILRYSYALLIAVPVLIGTIRTEE